MATTLRSVVEERFPRLAQWLSDAEPSLDENAVRELIGRDETEAVEFKERLLPHDRIAEYAVGIGNSGGGLLLFGVTDKKPRKLVGIPLLTVADLRKLEASIYNSTSIRVRLEPVHTQAGQFLIGIRIPSRPHGHVFCTQTGKYLTRVGESLVGIPPQEVSRLLQESRRPSRVGLTTLVLVAGALSIVIFVRVSKREHQVLTGRDSVLLGDVANLAGNAIFSDTIKQALAMKLQESPFLSFVPESRIREQLLAMGKSLDQPLSDSIAREICTRENAKAMLSGRIAPLGSHYVIAVNATSCTAGDVLVREQTEADSSEHVLKAVDKLAYDLRYRLGESLASIRASDTPVEQATTSSLPALQNYSRGDMVLANGFEGKAIRFFEAAIKDDPNFAMAYAKMAQAYDNLDESDRATAYAAKAFAMRTGLSRRESFYVTARYHDLVTGDVSKEIETLEDWKEYYPLDWMPRSDLANDYSAYFGRFDQAVTEAREAVRLNPKDAQMHATLADSLIGLNQFAEAKMVIQNALNAGLDSAAFHTLLFEITLVQGDTSATEEQWRWFGAHPGEEEVLEQEILFARFSGDLKVARQKSQELAKLRSAHKLPEGAATITTDELVVEAEYGNLARS